jgi:hypothetical protein
MEANREFPSGNRGRQERGKSPAGVAPARPAPTASFRAPGPLAEVKGLIASLDLAEIEAWTTGEALAALATMETAKRMLEARQALITAHVVTVRRTEQENADRSARNVPAEVARDVGLYRKVNGAKARNLVDLACGCPAEAPQTFALWLQGKVSEEQALILFRQTTLLTAQGRAEADERVSEDMPNLGLGALRERVDGIVAELEPELVAERRRKAAEQRRAGFTYRPDGMMNLSALLPGVAGQAMDTILSTYARSRRHAGDERTQDQLKADLLIALVIGWARATHGVPEDFLKAQHIGCGGVPGQPCPGHDEHPDDDAWEHPDGDHAEEPEERSAQDAMGDLCAPTVGFADVEPVGDLFAALTPPDDPRTPSDAPVPSGIPQGMEYDPVLGLVLPAGVGVQINLVMTDLALFGISDTPARLFGLGPLPAELGRELVHAAHARHAATLKRLYTEPVTGALVKMESTARTFPDGLGQMISLTGSAGSRSATHPSASWITSAHIPKAVPPVSPTVRDCAPGTTVSRKPIMPPPTPS